MAIPAAVYDKLKTLAARQSIISFTPAGGAQALLVVEYVGDGSSVDIARLMAPGPANGPGYSARSWAKSFADLYRFRTSELKRVPAILGGLTGHKSGVATIYLRDPDDAADVVSLKSPDDFACALYRDPTEIAHSGAAVSEITLIIESHEAAPLVWVPDADLSE